jgi:hypothetical protein
MADHTVTLRTWVKASEAEIRTGLCGYMSIGYGPWIFDGLVLRKTIDGRFAISFPARTDRSGRRHSYIRPANDEVRKVIEAELLWQLGEHPEFTP